MKRTPLNRSKLARSAGARSLRTARKATDDPVYLARVRLLPCAAVFLPGHVCRGPRIAHHAGRHGMGQRPADDTAICLCDAAHSDLHDRVGLSGTFATFNKSSLRAWEDLQIQVTRAALDHTPRHSAAF